MTSFDPRLTQQMSRVGAFPSLCKIQTEVSSRTATGDVTTTWQDLAGLEEIPCAISKMTPDKEERQTEMTKDATRGKILLMGAWPQITPTMRAIVAGDALPVYDIEDVNIGVIGGVTVLEVKYLPQAATPGLE